VPGLRSRIGFGEIPKDIIRVIGYSLLCRHTSLGNESKVTAGLAGFIVVDYWVLIEMQTEKRGH
jgi:hypothetical protein